MTKSISAILESFAIPPDAGRISNLSGSSLALMLSSLQKPYIMVEHGEERAKALASDIAFYKALLLKPPCAVFVPSEEGPEPEGRRALASRMASSGGCGLVFSHELGSTPLWKPDALEALILKLSPGMESARDAIEERLLALGYYRVSLVTSPGQYSLRGYILDLYPTTAGSPLRAEFFGDEIEELRYFDIETQRSVAEAELLEVLPARPPDEGEGIAAWDLMPGALICNASENGPIETAGAVEVSRLNIAGLGVEAPVMRLAGLGLLHDERKDIYALPMQAAEAARETASAIMIIASSSGQAERLSEVFAEEDMVCPVLQQEAAGVYEGGVFITSGELSEGLRIPGLMVLTEREVFGGRPSYRPIRRSKVAGLLTHIDDLSQGDYVVHAEKGIGVFQGLVHQEIEGLGYDMLLIEYSGGDRLYLPLGAIDRVRKYHAVEGTVPRMDSLGTKRWQRTRERVKKRIEELAEKLLKLYAGRELAEGHSFGPETEMHREFARFFQYEETPDQSSAIAAIIEDMESSKPMDRLLCGDVGYGKTEVAMRAVFKAVHEGRQAAVLVPTTLLCEQHLRVFRQRFSAFPVTIEGLSRFRTLAERKDVAARLAKGQVDILIATHAMLGRDLRFADIGLLVIDEEHRFGVKQKERLKDMTLGVDVLTMSATPIPRTLQMSLSGIRGMSLIETPPEERQAVHAQVAVFSVELVRDAVMREMERGGQAFIVHNRIKDIMKLHDSLHKAMPLVRIVVAHGQMNERELERVMLRFLNREADVLLSTAIVGSGLDIPTANTIIVDMAHMMGLADLYQLKGRVGRGNVRGEAYFLIPGEEIITGEARERLQALQDLSYMGAGFRLAMKDMEIRGAGNMLGPEQSGAIEAVGFDLYMEMLEEAVSSLKGEPVKRELKPSISIRVNAYVPEGYISDMALRLSAYRAVSSAKDEAELKAVEEEMSDRFGKPPMPFVNLLRVRRLALLAARAGIVEVAIKDGHLRMSFAPTVEVKAESIMRALDGKLRFYKDGFDTEPGPDAVERAGEVLERILAAA